MKVKFNFWPLFPLIVLLFGLEFASRSRWVPEYLAPAPTDILNALVQDSVELWTAFFQTAQNAFIGFLVSIFLGLFFGILFSTHRWIQKSFYPYATFFQTVPIIAVAPILVIWFGYGTPTVIASTVIVSIFPIIASTLSGIQSTDLALLDLFKIYRATRT
jgi:NitT/TauT family transport system permease protein